MAAAAPAAEDVTVVLADGVGPRVVGMRARARNRRVIARVGARELEQSQAEAALTELPADAPVLLLREDLTINVALFERLAAELPQAVRLVPERHRHATFALYGTAASVLQHLGAYFADAGLVELDELALDERALLPASTPQLARAATTALLHQAEKPTDGIVSRNLNRPLSRFFSRIFLWLGMTPMHASAINLAIGLACAWYAAQTGYLTMVIAGALFHLASAFDGVDGEMARTTLGESSFGAWVDTAVDNATYVACLIGVTVGWLREGIGPAELGLAATVVIGVPLTIVSLMRFVHRYGPDGSLVFVDRCVARAARDSGLPTLHAARFLFHALRRDVFAFLFFLISFGGSRAVVPLTVAVGLLVALFTLLGHRRQLVAAALALGQRPA